MITISIVYILSYTKLKQIVYQCINYVAWKRWPIQSAKCMIFVSKLKNFYFFWRVVLNWPQIMNVNLLVRVKCVFRTHVRQFCVQAINFQWKYTYFYFLTLSLSSWNCPAGALARIKGALYRIQILCRRYTFWSYPARLTIADPPGEQKLTYRRV